ncbi:MAG: hypothetical protein ACE37H_01235 [Phycisphaeraceae bacterium]
MGPDVDETNAVMIVVGSHLRAEECDRPLAYGLRARIEHWREQHADQLDVPLTPLVCTDLWYLNHADLQRRPTICLGGPGVNALAAINANQSSEEEEGGREAQPLPTEPRVTIMIDPDFTHLRVGVWGTDTELTEKGLQLFCDRYLDAYLRACVTQVEPKTD